MGVVKLARKFYTVLQPAVCHDFKSFWHFVLMHHMCFKRAKTNYLEKSLSEKLGMEMTQTISNMISNAA